MENESLLNSTHSPRRKPFIQSLHDAIHSFKPTERVIFYVLILISIVSGLFLLARLNNKFLVTVPDYGGSINEGIVGVPRFVNPVLAISDADKDIASLVFAGLLKAAPEGSLISDLSQEYTISEDGKTYTFILRDDIYFHDGKPITTDDVEFTIQRIQDPTIKSPLRPVWDGVSMQKTDSHKISFTLRQAYAPFIENFTVGIIPRHIWKDVPSNEFSFSELNVDATGNGPYEISDVKRNSFGLPTLYSLRSFSKYALGKPFIKNINLHFYQNEDELFKAFEKGDITSMSGVSPEHLRDLKLNNDYQVLSSTLPRVFGVFFNQNQASVFLNKEVREALTVALDKDRIVNEVLYGYATKIDSPIPDSEIASNEGETGSKNATSTSTPTSNPAGNRTDEAIGILSKNGWALNKDTGIMEKKTKTETKTLSFSLATGDAPELKRTAELIKKDWEKIGAVVEVKVFEVSDLNQNVIRPRKFDALLFGEVVGREFDLYPFWHSSQRNDPGLNIALYANISADKILQNLRTVQSRDERQKMAAEFDELFKEDLPAVFIYSPRFIYVVPKKITNINLGELTHSGERFLNINEWYIEANKVWEIFTK